MLYRRVLITGANGLLGQELVRQLSLDPAYDVLATARDDQPRSTNVSCGYVAMDLVEPGAIEEVFLDFAPDVVVNCAAMTQVDQCETERTNCWNINALAVETLAKLCLSTRSRLVQISTDFIFDGLSGPYRESARPNPLSYYGRSKLAGENTARAAGINQWAIARTVLLYGTGIGLSRSNFVLWVVEKLRRGEEIHIVDDQWRTPTYAPDLARGIERIIRYNKHGVYHLSGRELLSIYEIARTVADVFDLDSELIHPTDGTRFKQPAIRPPRTGFIVLKAESELGYNPLPFRAALTELRRMLDVRTARSEDASTR